MRSVKPEKANVCSVGGVESVTVKVCDTVEWSACVPVKVTMKDPEPPVRSGAKSIEFSVNTLPPSVRVVVDPAKYSKSEVSAAERLGRFGFEASHT